MKIKNYSDAIKNLEDQKALLKQALYHMDAIETIIHDFNIWAKVEFSGMTDEQFQESEMMWDGVGEYQHD